MSLNIPVLEIMISKVVTVTPSQKLIDVRHVFEKRNFHHHIPVIENGKLEGVISLIDFLFAIKDASLDGDDEAYHHLTVEHIMREHPMTMNSSSTLREVAQELAKGKVHAIVIADENKIKGIISAADVMQYLLKN